MIDENDYWILPLNTCQVIQIRIDYSFGLEFLSDQEEGYALRINSTFEIISTGGNKTLSPENEHGKLGPALELFMKKVAAAKAYKNGDLELRFEDGFQIFVPSRKELESWEISGPQGFLVVGIPGKLAIWNPK